MVDIVFNLNPKSNLSYQFLKYVRPIWYFHLKPHTATNRHWISFDTLSNSEKDLIQYDNKYSNSVLSNWDASYQALMLGIIKQTENKEDNNIDNEKTELYPEDIYRFMRKYYKKIWLYFTFLQRLI